MAKYRMHLLVCGGTSCRSSESSLIVENLKRELEEKGLTGEVQVMMTGCFGLCEKGPVVKVMPDNTYYVQVKPEDAPVIVAEHVIRGKPVQRLLFVDPKSKEHVTNPKQAGFYRKQIRIALRNCGCINPENIDEYIARDGYAALGKCLSELKPADVIDVSKKIRTARARRSRVPCRSEVGDSIKEPC